MFPIPQIQYPQPVTIPLMCQFIEERLIHSTPYRTIVRNFMFKIEQIYKRYDELKQMIESNDDLQIIDPNQYQQICRNLRYETVCKICEYVVEALYAVCNYDPYYMKPLYDKLRDLDTPIYNDDGIPLERDSECNLGKIRPKFMVMMFTLMYDEDITSYDIPGLLTHIFHQYFRAHHIFDPNNEFGTVGYRSPWDV